MTTIYQQKNLRVTKHPDIGFDIEDLKGDCYCPYVNSDIDPAILKMQETQFEERIETEGVWYYSLEKWNPEVGIGWETIASIGGFVGDGDEEHIASEILGAQINN